MKDILKFVQDFSKVRRWSQIHCTREESSLEHTAAVGLIALKIGSECPYEVNVARLLTKAMLHDMEETITGDIMTPVKYHNEVLTKAIKDFENESAKIVSHVFGHWSYEFWYSAKDESIEGCIIRIADKASVVYKYKQEIALGNTSFLQYEQNIWEALYAIKLETDPLFPDLTIYIHQLMDILQEKTNAEDT